MVVNGRSATPSCRAHDHHPQQAANASTGVRRDLTGSMAMHRLIRCQSLAETYSTCENLFPQFNVQFDGSSGDPCQYSAEITALDGVRVNSVRNSLAAR